MNTEIYFRLFALGAILVVALMHPFVSALVLTGLAAWHIQTVRIGETALVQKIVELAPPGMKDLIVNR